MGILGYLTLAFVFCKLAGLTAIATWSWVWVFSPIWGWLALLPFVLVYAVNRAFSRQLRPAGSTTVRWISGGYETKPALPAAPSKPEPKIKEPGTKYNRVNARPWGHSAKRRSAPAGRPPGQRSDALSSPTDTVWASDQPCPWPDMRHL